MDLQRIVAFVVFSFSLLMLWNAWQDYNHPKPVQTTQANGQPAGPALPMPGANLPAAQPQPVASGVQVASGTRAVVKTDVMTVVVDANGGDLRELSLDAYQQDTEVELLKGFKKLFSGGGQGADKAKPFKLFEQSPEHDYFAQSGFVGKDLPNHKTVYTLQAGEYDLKPGENTLKVSMTAQMDGVEVVKTYTFHRDSYVIDVDYAVHNGGTADVEGYSYFQFQRDGKKPEGQSTFISSYAGPAMYTESGKFQKIAFSDIDKAKQDFVKAAPDGWMGMVQHHFVAAWVTPNPDDKAERGFYADALGNGQYRAGMKMPTIKVAPGGSANVDMRLYAGPQDQAKLKTLAHGLEHVVDYGWLTVLAYPLFVFLSWLNSLVHNWGVAIILLTVAVKMAFYPLSAASYKSMAQMRKLAPRLQHLKERYGDDRQKLHEAMMKVYQEEKINPLGGCLPIVVQIPVFIALYWALMSAVELRQAPFALWITDLSEPDPYLVLPILMALTMFIQQKLSPTPPDPVQAKVMMIMPIAFSFMFLFFPSGLVLYWLVNNILSILQQWRINYVIERAGHGKPATK
ncbi:membrane protein insertase YidC [Parasulfuritortus cantonensis]|uniref:Membrane protein insertase YidC n=1 Tax=Parasulfuritortus cantonensis TaxID=2528202 RepID=A0A4R1B478_9PROT|nr:membrane protein insertase YidC [Parasulfuritortus cantonensis]TCJ12721.1 membrane protein insertase YidC [Parasulfuritortus cantonensis]